MSKDDTSISVLTSEEQEKETKLLEDMEGPKIDVALEKEEEKAASDTVSEIQPSHPENNPTNPSSSTMESFTMVADQDVAEKPHDDENEGEDFKTPRSALSQDEAETNIVEEVAPSYSPAINLTGGEGEVETDPSNFDEEVPRSSSSFDLLGDDVVNDLADEEPVLPASPAPGVTSGNDIHADSKQLADLFKYK